LTKGLGVTGTGQVRKKLLRLSLILVVNLVSIGLLAELTSNVVYLIKREAFFYGDERPAEPAAGDLYQVAEAVFHPYLGFINRVGRRGDGWATNNHGFQFSTALLEADPHCCDYPKKKGRQEVLVGIFGGSAAAGFALTAQNSPTLARRLGEIPGFSGKQVRILNFAMSGYRQPQQLITLAYYLSLGQKLDLVINLDGFNEIVTSGRNWESGADPTFPADTLWGAWGRHLEKSITPLESGDHLLSAYHDLASRDWGRKAEACGTASCFMLSQIVSLYHRSRFQSLDRATRADVERTSLFPTNWQSSREEIADIYEYTAERWSDSSLAMAQLMRDRGGLYLHVLQPNQWLKKSGDYVPIDPDHIYQWIIEPVNRGYPALTRRIPELESAGVRILDATMLFSGEDNRRIFLDDCCHYTDQGYEILFEAIARRVGAG
jgi:hypothetical protein